MEVLRNNEVIGYNFYFFKRNGKETIVTNQIQFEVKLLGATIFKVEGYAEEKYLDDQLYPLILKRNKIIKKNS
jgi:hypothetical protein